MRRVLIVDDSAAIRNALREMFEREGWNVCGEASDGQEAIGKAQALTPDVIVLDLSMPVMNGLTAASVLKNLVPSSRLILFTSFADLVPPDKLERAGFSASVSKDEVGKLMSTVQRPLD